MDTTFIYCSEDCAYQKEGFCLRTSCNEVKTPYSTAGIIKSYCIYYSDKENFLIDSVCSDTNNSALAIRDNNNSAF